MDFNEIRKLVKLVESAGITSLEIEEGELQIRIEKAAPVSSAPQLVYASAPAAAPAPAAPAAAPAAPAAEAPVASNLIEVRAPMVGTFYRSPNPESPPFVEVGDSIRPGQTLCILEAMKIMNEIEAEVSGRIAEVLIDNGQPVQFDQVLYRIEP